VVGREVVLVSSADETAFEVAALPRGSGAGRGAGTGRRAPVPLVGARRVRSGTSVRTLSSAPRCPRWSPCRGRVAGAPTGMTLSVTVLGCSGTYAAGRRLQRLPGAGLSARRCGRRRARHARQPPAHIDLDELDGVVLSHAHPDHWSTSCRSTTSCATSGPAPGSPCCRPRRWPSWRRASTASSARRSTGASSRRGRRAHRCAHPPLLPHRPPR
jgi:hypothetical protein